MRGAELRAARARLGLSRELVAGRFGIQTRAVARLEDDDREVFADIAAWVGEVDALYRDIYADALRVADGAGVVTFELPDPSTDLAARVETAAIAAAGAYLTHVGVEVTYGYGK